MKITQLRIQDVGGTDIDSSGTADWQENRLKYMASVDKDAPAESAVSPVCIEGSGYYLDRMKLLSSYIPPENELPVEDDKLVNITRRAPHKRWYSNIPLDPNAETQLNISWQDERRQQNHTVKWTATNVMTAEDMTIRADDALLLNGYPEDTQGGDVLIEVDGEQYLTIPGEPVVHRFELAGSYIVTTTWTPESGGGQVTEEIEVTVETGTFNGTPTCLLNKERSWRNSNLPEAAVLEYDHHLTVTQESLTDGGRLLYMTINRDMPAYMIARLGEDGPVMATTKIKAVSYSGASKSLYHDIIETYDDGSTLSEMRISLSRVPDDLEIELNIFVSGVIFEDGTTTRMVTAEDFNEFGEYRYRMIKSAGAATSVCHTIKMFQDGVMVGDM